MFITPGERPLEELAARLTALEEVTDRAGRMLSLQDGMGKDERTLHAEVRTGLAGQHSSARLLLVVDQFEELFTLCQSHQQPGRAG